MVTEIYIVIKDNQIIEKFHTSDGIEGVKKSLNNIQYDEIRKVPDKSFHDIYKNTNINEYEPNWELKKMSVRVADGFVQIPENHKLDGEIIRPMNLQERVDAGIIEMPTRTKILDDKFIPMTEAELVASGQVTQKQLDDEKKVAEREQLIQAEMRKMAEERLIAQGKI